MKSITSERPSLLVMESNCIKYFIWLFASLLIGCGQQNDFKSIFDGSTFTGWEGPLEFFRIEGQSIVAGTLNSEIPLNQFLCSEESYSDFQLRMQVKFTSRENNAGIQFRSQRIPNNHEVIGYQADVGHITERPIWGSLYDESRRKKFLAHAPVELIEKVLKPDDWNDYRIRCIGPEITFWINEEEVLHYTEDDLTIKQEGQICLQIHSGRPAEAWYRDIEIRRIEIRDWKE